MPKDLELLFDELLLRYTGTIEEHYRFRYKRAKDKEFVIEEIKKHIQMAIVWSSIGDEQTKITDVFLTYYKKGEKVSDILNHIRTTYGEIPDELPFKQIINGKRITLYLSEEEKALKKLALNERKVLKLAIRNIAYNNIQKKLPELFNSSNHPSNAIRKKPSVLWTSPKDTKNEFVQLIYGLYEAGFINNGSGEITKIVETLAENFGIKLGKNWQSNHSASIHKSKRNYTPPVFEAIKSAYLTYTNTLIEGKRKNK